MDLDEWEFLPDTKSFLDFGHEGGGKQQLLPFDDHKLVLEMNYFICPSKSTTPSRHVGAEDNSGDDRKRRAVKQAIADEEFKDIGVVLPPPSMVLGDSDVVSQVFFNKMKENELADMKVTSPKSCCKGFTLPLPEPEPIQLGAGEEAYDLDQPAKEMAMGAAEGTEVESCEGSDVKSKHGREGFSVGLCRWKMTGAGALCSIGAAAATICCIFVLGGRQRQHQKIQFQIYADEKRIKHAVHQATRLNHALSAVRGAPMTRAHISFGGYYEGL